VTFVTQRPDLLFKIQWLNGYDISRKEFSHVKLQSNCLSQYKIIKQQLIASVMLDILNLLSLYLSGWEEL
jgi:hypothetical protein